MAEIKLSHENENMQTVLKDRQLFLYDYYLLIFDKDKSFFRHHKKLKLIFPFIQQTSQYIALSYKTKWGKQHTKTTLLKTKYLAWNLID